MASVSGSTLTWTGDLPAGQRATIRYAVTVRAAAGGDNLLRSTVTSPTRGATCPIGGSDPRCSVSVPVARLTLQQSYREPTATPGSVVHLSSTFTNSGQVPYTGISIVIPAGDIVDDLVANGDQVASSGSLIVTADTFTWVGSIAVGETVTVSGTLTVADPDPGNKLVTGTLVTSAPGSNCASGSTDTRCTARLAVLVPQLSITKTASASYVVPGGTEAYTITLANTGQTPYAGTTVTDDLAGVLDDATYNGDAVASRGSIAYASPTLTWTGDLAVGESATITYTVTSLDPAPGRQGDGELGQLDRGGVDLPAVERRRGLPGHRPRPDPCAEHHQDPPTSPT